MVTTWKTVLFVTAPRDSDEDLKAAIALCIACGAHLSVLLLIIAAHPFFSTRICRASAARFRKTAPDRLAVGRGANHLPVI